MANKLLKPLTKQLNASFTDTLRNQLEMMAMAKDQQIQTEIKIINQEFIFSESIGISHDNIYHRFFFSDQNKR